MRLVAEATPQHESQWAAIESVAAKIGASAETVRKWVRRAEVDAGERIAVLGRAPGGVHPGDDHARSPPALIGVGAAVRF